MRGARRSGGNPADFLAMGVDGAHTIPARVGSVNTHIGPYPKQWSVDKGLSRREYMGVDVE